jgi:hypothetical protein
MLMAAALLAGCVAEKTGMVGVSGIREITPAEAQSCTLLTNVRSKPGVYGPLATQGIEIARNQALSSAKEAGANAVVFEQVSPGEQIYEVRLGAYRC